MTDDRILVFVPMYRCEQQIPRVLARIGQSLDGLVERVVVIDNGSPDGSRAAAERAAAELPIPVELRLNDDNYNLGGSHKVAFDLALDGGYSHVLVVHGDDQADPEDFRPRLEAGEHRTVEALLGSRFALGAQRSGYSWFRTFGNRVFNLLFSMASGRWLNDLGSGLNCFAMAAFNDRFYRRLADDLTFNNYLLLAMVARRMRLRFVPITWREEDQVSNVRMVRQARRTLAIVCGYALRRGAFLECHRGGQPEAGYSSQVVWRNQAAEQQA